MSCEYPMWFREISSGIIVKFTDKTKGVVVRGLDTHAQKQTGFRWSCFIPHDKEYNGKRSWEQVEDPDGGEKIASMYKTFETKNGDTVRLMGIEDGSHYKYVGVVKHCKVWTAHMWDEQGISYFCNPAYDLVEIKPMSVEEAICFMVLPSNQNIGVMASDGYVYCGVEGTVLLAQKFEKDPSTLNKITFKRII